MHTIAHKHTRQPDIPALKNLEAISEFEAVMRPENEARRTLHMEQLTKLGRLNKYYKTVIEANAVWAVGRCFSTKMEAAYEELRSQYITAYKQGYFAQGRQL